MYLVRRRRSKYRLVSSWFSYLPRIFPNDSRVHNQLRILTGKKRPKIKVQRLGKVRILAFGSLLHQFNSFQEVLKLEIFQKIEVVTGKTPHFMIGTFYSRHSYCLTTGFWQSILNGNEFFSKLVVLTKNFPPGFCKRFLFSRKFVSKLKYWKRLKLSLIVT